MKLSKSTSEILKNFSSINPNILVKPGSSLNTISPMKNIICNAKVTETFPVEFGVFNLVELLSILSMMTDPEIQFEQKWMVLSEGKSKIRYYYSSPDILLTPKKDLNEPPFEIQFDLTAEQLSQTLKAAAVLSVNDIVVEGDGEKIVIKVTDKKNDTSNAYEVDVGVPTSEKFSAVFLVSNWKQLPADYTVSISKKRLSKFEAKGVNVQYYIALEDDSVFN